jgi:D-lactate dehydrogenase
MKVVVYSAKSYERRYLDEAAAGRHHFIHVDCHCSASTAPLAAGSDAICTFVNDRLDAGTLRELRNQGIRMVALRCAGFNQVDLDAATDLGIRVARVPAYSPHAVAEHTFALILALNRRIHRAYNRVREGNFSLDGLIGVDLRGKTIGVIGTGRIGTCVIAIARGFGMEALASDPCPNREAERLGAHYVATEDVLARSDIVTLHCPLNRETHHLIDDAGITAMRRGAMLINTSRGGLVDTRAVIGALKSGHLGYLGLDVYEEEAELFFEDRSQGVIQDDVFSRLLTFPNVLITGHQAFLTQEALANIAVTTIENLDCFAAGRTNSNQLVPIDPPGVEMTEPPWTTRH